MKWPRRLWRSAIVVTRWGRYLRTAGSLRLWFLDLRMWLRTTLFGGELVDLDLPWLCFPATRFLKEQIRPGLQVFEWGSGASTLFFGRRDCVVVSAEHDPDWAVRSRSWVEQHPKVQVLAFSSPDEDYVGAVDRFPTDSLDLVVVDGRRRCDCLAKALLRVRPGGWVILDDSERKSYGSCLDALPKEGWEIKHFEGPRPGSTWPVFGRTTFMRRLAP